jgi:hypothetical protein
MDFIERLFGISPDGGNGMTELLYCSVFLVIIGAALLRRKIRSFRGRRHHEVDELQQNP